MNLQEARNLKNAVRGQDRTLFTQIYFSNIFQLKHKKKTVMLDFSLQLNAEKNGRVTKVSAFPNEPFRRFNCFNI